MDVISLSFGSGSSFQTNPISVLGETLSANGMMVVAPAGDDGGDGVWMVSDAGLGESASSVASVDNNYVRYRSFTYGDISRPYSSFVAINPAPIAILPLFNFFDGKLADGCQPFQYNQVDVDGKFVLVTGNNIHCSMELRAFFAQDAGAAGIIIQTTPFGIAPVPDLDNQDFPVVSIEFQAGEDIAAAFKKNSQTLISFGVAKGNFAIEGGGLTSAFSSYGLDGELRSKPDLGAPGGDILSTYPIAQGGYAVLSGTSLATSYIAGAHALYMQSQNKHFRGSQIRKVLKNTATITNNFNTTTPFSAARQGAGLVNVLNAITTTTCISPDHIDLYDTVRFRKTVHIKIRNEGKLSETYTLSHTPADALNSYAGIRFLNIPIVEADYATVGFSANPVDIAPGETVTIALTFKKPKKGDDTQWPIYSGYVIATPKTTGSIPVHVPYTGLKGDFSKMPIQDVSFGFPFPVVNGRDPNGLLSNTPPGTSFDLRGPVNELVPVVLTREGSPTPRLTIRVYDSQNVFKGYLYSPDLGLADIAMGRDRNWWKPNYFSLQRWSWLGDVLPEGTSTLLSLPSGSYRLEVASQRKFTAGLYPQDYEILDLGTYNILTNNGPQQPFR
ncbi:hypothetical protein BGZ98_003583 [Dissophora globulifera]|nr:hypothetical protein BGZ98_003583 [Dissophora globulifera]